MSATKTVVLSVLFAVVLAACTGGSGATDSIPDTTVGTSTSTTSQAPTPTTTAAATTTTTTPVPPDDEVLAGWNAYWAAWARQRAFDPIDRTALEEVASAQVVDAAIAFFEKERDAGAPLAVPRVVPSGVVTSVEGDTATIEACTMISRSPSDVPGTMYDVTMKQTTDGRWIVEKLAVASAAGCVPIEMAAAAIAAYEAYWDDRDALSNPADPDAEWLKERTTGEHLAVMEELYSDWQEQGLYFEGRPETHPEVVFVIRDWTIVILDCMVIPPEWGVFEVATGNRTDDAEPVGPDGRIDLRSAHMRNDMADGSGTWRVERLAGEVNASCEFAPTDEALPQS